MHPRHSRDANHHSHTQARGRIVALLCCLVCVLPFAIVACGQVSGAAGATPSPTSLPKWARLATAMAAQETVAAGLPHAPKHPETPAPTPNSCPIPTPQPIITQPSLPTQGYPDANVDNVTVTIPADQPRYEYHILAGDRKSNPRQGLLIVWTMATDPCANPTSNLSFTYYNTPFQQGHVQLTGVDGDTVTFTTADSGSTIYRFDFVTGKFL